MNTSSNVRWMAMYAMVYIISSEEQRYLFHTSHTVLINHSVTRYATAVDYGTELIKMNQTFPLIRQELLPICNHVKLWKCFWGKCLKVTILIVLMKFSTLSVCMSHRRPKRNEVQQYYIVFSGDMLCVGKYPSWRESPLIESHKRNPVFGKLKLLLFC